MIKSHIRYNPTLSIADNARRNGCSEENVRYYIKVNCIDRNAERVAKTINDLRRCYSTGKTLVSLVKETGYSVNTVKKYLPFVLEEAEPSKIGSQKRQKLTVRQKKDYYATHPSVTRDILGVETFCSPILEPCCGGGFMAEEIKKAGYEVDAFDLIDRGYGTGGIDFLKHDWEAGKYDIITNPPYTAFVPMLEQAMKVCRNKVAMLLPLRYLSSKERFEIFRKYPPKCVYVYIERICIAKNGDFANYEAGQNLEIYAWYVWEKDYCGEPFIRWITNRERR